jgi:hypothetical protein
MVHTPSRSSWFTRLVQGPLAFLRRRGVLRDEDAFDRAALERRLAELRRRLRRARQGVD